jgi:O-acetyl-ADP-ribose deacetylase (regulator of RNase III)
METSLNHVTLKLIQGDLTELVVDAIVNSTTTDFDLTLGTGEQILRKGGMSIQVAVQQHIPGEEGQSVLTTAGNLPSRYVIHAVGPRMGSGNERGKLASAVWNTLRLAVQHQLTSIAFPPISIGALGYPIEGCATVMAQKIVDFTFEDTVPLKTIIVCLETASTFHIFEQAFRREVDTARADAP